MLIPAPSGTTTPLGVTSGTALLDAAAQGSDITGVQFVVSYAGVIVDNVVATATPTIYGWIGEWNLNNSPIDNKVLNLQSVVTQAGGATAMSAPVTVLVVNVP